MGEGGGEMGEGGGERERTKVKQFSNDRSEAIWYTFLVFLLVFVFYFNQESDTCITQSLSCTPSP